MKIIFILLLLFQAYAVFGETFEVQPGVDTLQSVVDKAKDGDIIRLSAGTYESKKAIIFKNKKNITIEGNGESWIICDDIYEPVIQIKQNSSTITFKNIKAKHKEPAPEYQCHGAVIEIENSKDIDILDCELNGCGAMGVSAYQSKNINITGCYIHNNSFTAFYLADSESIRITRSRIENNQSFLELVRVKHFQMWGNSIKNNEGYHKE